LKDKKDRISLGDRYPPSPPCDCPVCLGYCARPGWWTVSEAERAIQAGYGSRMMMEMSPDRVFGVLSPAFKGSEGDFARQIYASRGCTFLKEKRCELHGSGFQPLECRYCHHDRVGSGPECHADIAADWNSAQGRALVVRWTKLVGLWPRLKGYGLV
jgi:hypothetical protein